jgi:MATE family multidrug resistance protein
MSHDLHIATDKANGFDVTHHSAIKIALPMTLAFLTTPILGIVDLAVVGRMNDEALIGGLAVGAIIFDVIFTTFNFLRSGTTGLTAQALGKNDEKEMQAVFFRALFIAIFFGVIVSLFTPLLLDIGLYFMAPSPEVAAATKIYLLIRGLSAMFSLGNYAILGWLLGLGRAGSGLALQTILNGMNIILSYILGLKMNWGIEGVAWATVISEAFAFLIGMLWIAKLMNFKVSAKMSLIWNIDKLRQMIAVNADIMVRSFALLFAFAFFTSVGARYGDTTLAANAILLHLFFIGGYFLDGFATAAEQLVGRSIGANYRPAFDKAIKITLQWGAGLALALFGLYALCGGYFIDSLTTVEAVRSEARLYLFWAILSVLTGVLAFEMDGIFIGATWTSDMRNMMIASLVVYLAVWWIATPYLENHGLWLAFNAFLLVRGLFLFVRMPTRIKDSFS